MSEGVGDLEETEDSSDTEDSEYPHESEDGRRELGVGLRHAQLDDHVHQRHAQYDQVKQVPHAEEVPLPQSDHLGSKFIYNYIYCIHTCMYV